MALVEETKEEDKKTICRVCLNFDYEQFGEGLSVFEKHNNVYVYEKINYLANIEVKEDDHLPDRICSVCLLALENACNFKQQCENSDAILHSSTHIEPLIGQETEVPIKAEVLDEYDFNFIDGNSSFPEEQDINTDCEDPIERKPKDVPFKSKAIDLKLECHDCGGSFKSKCKLRVHWKKVHLPQQLLCPFCKKRLKSYRSYHNHMKKRSQSCINAAKIRVEGEGKSRIYHCKECDTKSPRIHTIMTHLVTHSGERPYMCNHCGRTFTQISSLAGHKESVHNETIKEGTCHQCGKYIKGRNRWYRHMRWHANVQLPCTVCNKVFASKSGLRVHMKRHSDVKSFTCELCAKLFHTSSDLRNHKVKTHFKDRIYTCQECEYKTPNFGSMSKHRKRHTGNNIACEICGRFVENQQQLILHKKRHFERNFKCTLCDKMYYGRRNLLSHVRKVHNVYVGAASSGKSTLKVEVKRDSQSV